MGSGRPCWRHPETTRDITRKGLHMDTLALLRAEIWGLELAGWKQPAEYPLSLFSPLVTVSKAVSRIALCLRYF